MGKYEILEKKIELLEKRLETIEEIQSHLVSLAEIQKKIYEEETGFSYDC